MGIRSWLAGKPKEEFSEVPPGMVSIGDPALAEWLGIAGISGIPYGDIQEYHALGIPAYNRAINIIAGTIASLPLKSYRNLGDGTRLRTSSFLDNPAGPYKWLNPFSWKELVLIHLLVGGETFLMHSYNVAGQLIGLLPVHRYAVEVQWNGPYDKLFTVQMGDGSRQQFTTDDMTQIMAFPDAYGLRGLAPLTLFRNTFKLAMAGEAAATRTFTDGALIAGFVSPDSDITEDEAKALKAGLMQKIAGVGHAGDIAVLNRPLHYTPWAMSNEDAQFIQSREFQVLEFARMLGIPLNLMNVQNAVSNWGSGISEQNSGLARYTLSTWTSRIEEALSMLLPQPRFCEFDMSGLVQGTPAEEIALLISQVEAGILTDDEARAIRNLPPLTPEQRAQNAPKPLVPPTLVLPPLKTE